MKTCSTCRHWRDLDEWDVKAGGLRKCAAVREKCKVEDEIGEAAREGRADAQDAAFGLDLNAEEVRRAAAYRKAVEDAFAAAKAVVNDGSSYKADLLTRPDFGCVLHEDKP